MKEELRVKRSKSLLILLIIATLVLSSCMTGCSSKEEEETTVLMENGVRIIADMAGREVEVPAKIEKVFPTSPVGAVFIYTLDPELLIAWNDELRQHSGGSEYLPSKYRDLPHLGGWYAKATCNIEELLKIHPDIILSVGNTDQTAISQADTIQEQLNIPVFILSSDLDKINKSYELAGDLLNLQEQAGKLGIYCDESYKDIRDKAQSINENQRLAVYYAEGPAGLQTEPKGSGHTRVLDIVGGENIADVAASGGKGLTAVSMEQLLSWNPDVIISWTSEQGGYYENIMNDPKWESLNAVINKKVYAIPGGPFNWFERPPSANQVLGLKWLGNLLYPDVYKYDMAEETREFYKKFYHYELTDEELTSLLKDSGGE